MVKYIRMYYDVIDRGSLLQLQINVSSDVEHYTYSIMMECKKFNSMTFQPQSFFVRCKKGLCTRRRPLQSKCCTIAIYCTHLLCYTKCSTSLLIGTLGHSIIASCFYCYVRYLTRITYIFRRIPRFPSAGGHGYLCGRARISVRFRAEDPRHMVAHKSTI